MTLQYTTAKRCLTSDEYLGYEWRACVHILQRGGHHELAILQLELLLDTSCIHHRIVIIFIIISIIIVSIIIIIIIDCSMLDQ